MAHTTLPQIVLHSPEIPQNTGTIGRLCAATFCRLIVTGTPVFELSDRSLKRAGLDYWPYVDWEVRTLEELLEAPFAMLSKYGRSCYTKIPTSTRYLIFGGETRGLPADLRQAHPEKCFQIPLLQPAVRSLNLANAVSIVLYDQLRQRGLLAPPH